MATSPVGLPFRIGVGLRPRLLCAGTDMLGNGDVPASDRACRSSSSERIEECLECGDSSILSLVDKGLEGRAVRPGLGASSFCVREASSLFESDSAIIQEIQRVLKKERGAFNCWR